MRYSRKKCAAGHEGKAFASEAIEAAKLVLYTGHISDGKFFVFNVEDVIKVRTGETGYDALQDVE